MLKRRRKLLLMAFLAFIAAPSLPSLLQDPGLASAFVSSPAATAARDPAHLLSPLDGKRIPASKVKAPILLYHYIEPLSPANWNDRQRADFITTPEDFEKHLQYLRSNDYVSIDLYQLYDSLIADKSLPAKAVVFTFDDGEISQYTCAFPLMKKYGFTGTIFVITMFADEERKGYITWDQAMEMARDGWRLEPHTKWHPSLRGNSRQYQFEQIGGSAEALSKHLGYMPRFFSYPYGEYDATSIQVAREVGLLGAVTTTPGDRDNLMSIYELPRTELFASTTQKVFQKLLAGHRSRPL
jgi:peptidoglycan/xylan/chitin deacetylase (PgdA/CDA1 family)